jgi:hypothetical protein
MPSVYVVAKSDGILNQIRRMERLYFNRSQQLRRGGGVMMALPTRGVATGLN